MVGGTCWADRSEGYYLKYDNQYWILGYYFTKNLTLSVVSCNKLYMCWNGDKSLYWII